MIKIKTEEEIKLLRNACSIVSKVIAHLKTYLHPGVTTAELDQEAEKLIKKLGAVSAFKWYRGYPANICTSVNEEVVHGIPSERELKEGDIISLDVGVKLNGYFGDAACTLAVGAITEETKKILKCTKESLKQGIAQAVAGNHLTDISHAVQMHAESNGYSVVRKFVGHGIGSEMHEEPEIPNFGKPGLGPKLKPGMVLAIEPMLNAGKAEVDILKDSWTAVTRDKSLSAHYEHTICITEGKPEILTAWE